MPPLTVPEETVMVWPEFTARKVPSMTDPVPLNGKAAAGPLYVKEDVAGRDAPGSDDVGAVGDGYEPGDVDYEVVVRPAGRSVKCSRRAAQGDIAGNVDHLIVAAQGVERAAGVRDGGRGVMPAL